MYVTVGIKPEIRAPNPNYLDPNPNKRVANPEALINFGKI
jgi:hypothetical protein